MMINVHSKYHSIKLITFGTVRLLGESSKHVNVVINWTDLPTFCKTFLFAFQRSENYLKFENCVKHDPT